MIEKEKKQVQTEELIKALLQLRSSFMKWDNERRKKVDIVLHALRCNGRTVNLRRTIEHIDLLKKQNTDYVELAPSAKKMLQITYLDLAQSDEERAENLKRMKRAHDKLKSFEDKNIIK